MSPTRRLFAPKPFRALLLFVPLALFFVIRVQLSWRPRVFPKMRGEITALAWSPNGQWLAAAAGATKVWGAPSEMSVRPVFGKGKNKWFKIPKTLQTLRFSADGRELVGIDIAQNLRRWDWQKRVGIPSALPKGVFALSDDAAIAAVKAQGGVAIHLVQNGKRIGFLKDERGILKVAAFSQDSKKLALFFVQSSRAEGLSLQIWNFSAESQPSRIYRDSAWQIPDSLKFFPNDTLISLKFFNGSSATQMFITPSQLQITTAPLAFSDDYGNLAIEQNASVLLLQGPKWTMKRDLSKRISPSNLKNLAFSPDGATLAGGDDKGFITLWRIK